ncbi:hypothetical protein FE391_37105 [Nonomuraea sp. KC401]|nr:hypothetical protein FE391_37105 [Nonomuraea sp. KC401]
MPQLPASNRRRGDPRRAAARPPRPGGAATAGIPHPDAGEHAPLSPAGLRAAQVAADLSALCCRAAAR